MASMTATTQRAPMVNLTPREASELLGVAPQTLAMWRSSGRVQLPYFKLGHAVRYRRADLEAFIASNMRGGA